MTTKRYLHPLLCLQTNLPFTHNMPSLPHVTDADLWRCGVSSPLPYIISFAPPLLNPFSFIYNSMRVRQYRLHCLIHSTMCTGVSSYSLMMMEARRSVCLVSERRCADLLNVKHNTKRKSCSNVDQRHPIERNIIVLLSLSPAFLGACLFW